LAHLPFDIQYNIWWQQFSVIFLRIKLQNLVQFKQYYGKSGARVLLVKARFFRIISFVYFALVTDCSLSPIKVGTFQWIQTCSIPDGK